MKSRSSWLNVLLILLVIVFVRAISISTHQSLKDKSLYHVLLFKWKPEVKEAQIKEINDLWEELEDKVKGFEEYEINPLESGDYDHVVILRFSSAEAYSAYQHHEDHQKISEMGPGLVARFGSFSYWR